MMPSEQKTVSLRLAMRFLRRLQDIKRLNPNQAALLLNVPSATYHYWLNKADTIHIKYLARIRSTFGLSWEELGRLIDDEIGQNQADSTSKDTSKAPKPRPKRTKAP